MNLERFPFDKQTCSIKIESCELIIFFLHWTIVIHKTLSLDLSKYMYMNSSTVGYTTNSIQLRWSNISENAVALNQTSLPQFEVTGRNYSHRERTHRFRGTVISNAIPNVNNCHMCCFLSHLFNWFLNCIRIHVHTLYILLYRKF